MHKSDGIKLFDLFWTSQNFECVRQKMLLDFTGN